MVDLVDPHGDIALLGDERLTLGAARDTRGALVLTETAAEGERVRCEFPINPPEIKVRRGRNTSTVAIINLGDVLLPGSLALVEISFEAILPRYYDASLCNFTPADDPNAFVPENIVSRLEHWMGYREDGPQANPTVLQVTVTHSNFSRPMVVTAVEDTDKGGEPDSLYVSVTLTEWRDQRIEVTRGDPRPRAEPAILARAGGTGDGFPTLPNRAESALAFVSIFGLEAADALREVLAAEERAARLREQSNANPDDYSLALEAAVAQRTAQELRDDYELYILNRSPSRETIYSLYQSHAGGGYVATDPDPDPDIEGRQFRPLPGSTLPSRREPRNPGVPQSYTTHAGDNLARIAEFVYGEGNQGLWSRLLAANYRALVPTPLRGAVPVDPPARWTPLRGGIRLTIPPLN